MNRLLLIVLILSVPFLAHTQDTIRIVSEKRVIIPIEINGSNEYVLLDTGSTLNIINASELKRLNLNKSFLIGTLESNHSKDELYSLSNCKSVIARREYMQFGTANISSAVQSIRDDTGIEIVGIIGAPAIKELGMVIDLNKGIITIK